MNARDEQLEMNRRLSEAFNNTLPTHTAPESFWDRNPHLKRRIRKSRRIAGSSFDTVYLSSIAVPPITDEQSKRVREIIRDAKPDMRY